MTTLRIDQIEPNPHQPRTRIDPEDLSGLADSIREHGILQPLIVSEGESADRFVLIAGERRLHAARQAGLERVPVLVREATDLERLELALIENLQRADLNPLEEAEAFRQLTDDFGLSHDEIAHRVSKSRTAVTNTLRLLKLSDSVQKALFEGLISEGHARCLLALPTPQAQGAALQTILTHDLNVRQAEALVRKLTGLRPPIKSKENKSPEVTSLESRLEKTLGTRVNLKTRGSQGTIVLYYYSDEELNSLIDRLLGPSWDN